MKKLDFIGIGVQKSATSWMFQSLIEHPEIQAGREKEVNFFNFKYQYGYHWYQQNFQFTEKITGEFSTQYFWDKNVPERIYKFNPDIKLLLCLRNPVDRAFSQHQHEIRKNRVPEELLAFERAVDSNPSYIDQGMYAEHLKRFLKHFKKDQILVVFQEDISNNPDQVLAKLYHFLNIDSTFKPPVKNKKINIARTYRSRKIDSIYRSLKKTLHKYTHKNIIKWIKYLNIHSLIENYNSIAQDKKSIPPMTETTRINLEKIFVTDINELETLINHDLSNWYAHIKN